MRKGLNKRIKDIESTAESMKPRRGVNVRVKANRFGVATVAQPQSKTTTAGTVFPKWL